MLLMAVASFPLDVLLGDFFEFFGNFDFRRNSLNLRKVNEF